MVIVMNATYTHDAHHGSQHASTSDLSAQSPSRRLAHRRARGILARSTVIHTQLRDLLVCPDGPGEVVTNTYQSMNKYCFPSSSSSSSRHHTTKASSSRGLFSNVSGRKEHIQALNFIPNVLVKGCGLLAAGGHQAEISILPSPSSSSSSLSSSSTYRRKSWHIKTHVGHSINNSIDISPDPFHPLSVPQLRISNNDSCIYHYSLHYPKEYSTFDNTLGGEEEETSPPELMRKGKTRLETPVNHCSVSPDGTRMIAVGDTNQVFCYDVGKGDGGEHTLVDTVEVLNDACFSTSWSRTGLQYAIASQSGHVSIFDIRRPHSPLKIFTTHHHSSFSSFSSSASGAGGGGMGSGAARVVKYSPGPNELLAFSEQKGFIHLIDARTYDHIEEVDLLQTELEEYGRPVASVASSHHDTSGYGGRAVDLPSERTRSLALMELERRNNQERHPLLLGSTAGSRLGTTNTISRGQQTSPARVYSGSRSIVARDPNPWDTFGSDDRSLVRRGDPVSNGWQEGTFDEDEEDGIEDDEMEWQDCPVLPVSTASNADRAYIYDTSSRTWQNSDTRAPPSSSSFITSEEYAERRARLVTSLGTGQLRALPPLDSYNPHSTSDLLFPSSTNPPHSTVSQLLSSISDTSNEGASHASNWSSLSPASSGSITGLDWDSSGRYLYASMERIVLEWKINEDGRRCVPSASLL